VIDFKKIFQNNKGKDFKSFIKANINGNNKKKYIDFIKGNFNKEDAAYAGLTVGDFIYDYTRVDPTILEGIDFSRTEDLSNIFNFSNFAKKIKGLNPEDFGRNISQMQGYVAERLVAQNLQSSNFEIEFPDTPNNPAFDILVNGEPFQIKNLANPSALYRHLDTYPEVPVLINEDLADKIDIGELENVYPVQGINHDEVVDATEDAIQDGYEVMDFEIPLIAVTISGGRNLFKIIRGQTDLNAAFKNITFDVLGMKIGGSIGVPVISTAGLIIFGPAGGVVGGLTGAILGANKGRKYANSIKRKYFTKKEKNDYKNSIKKILSKSKSLVKNNIEVVKEKYKKYEEKFIMKDDKNSKILWSRIKGDLEDYYLYLKGNSKKIKNNNESLKQIKEDPISHADKVIKLINRSGVFPANLRKEYEELKEALKKYSKKLRKYL